MKKDHYTTQRQIMKKAVLLFLYIFSWFFLALRAQTKFWDSPAAYLGQSPPGNLPKVFAPGLLADSPYFAANRVAFSADGKEFYYCHNLSWANNDNLKIKYFRYENGNWNGPFVLNEHYFAPTLSVNDSILYFEGSGGKIWCSERKQDGWSKPSRFLQSRRMYDFIPTIGGTIYGGSSDFVGADKRPNNFDVCTISISKSDTSLQSLGVPINSPGWNGDFFVARDESFLIISTNETSKFECDLYISYRKPDKTWTNPKSLGPLINNGLAHRYGQYVTNDNKFLFYCYGRSEKDCAIYWVRFDTLLDSLRRTNFDPYVYNPLQDQTFAINKKFVIQIPERTFVDDDGANTLSYAAQLSDGHRLPSWLRFDPIKEIFSGNGSTAGTLNITVIATDRQNARAQCNFNLTLTRRAE